MELEEINQALADYQALEGFTHSDMDDLVSGDIDRTVRIFLPNDSTLYAQLCAVMIRTVLRVIDSGAYVSKAFSVNEIKVDNLAVQRMEGEHTIVAGFAGAGDSLLSIANPFAQEEFETVDLDALDAVGEFVNCVNGLLASELSLKNISVDMLPPEYYDHPVTVTGNGICVFPVYINDQTINFILAIDSEIKVE
jgi:CheY-specific phosphatase CheX